MTFNHFSTTQMPEVTIIVPVYNVEQYLRQCLDSVVNQTLRDIEIICVNDGSPDGSSQILEEYAANDSRITVIHNENGGLSSARNAAYPYIKGQYTLFVDSDDWIEPDLCEKTVCIANREDADMTLYFFHRQTGRTHDLEDFLNKHPFSLLDKITLLKHMSAWSKLWRSSFLLDNTITFPEGLYSEDVVAHWKAVILNPKLAVVPEKLYWYRINPSSITEESTRKNLWSIPEVYKQIKDFLINEGKYEGDWKNIYLRQKLQALYSASFGVPHEQRLKMIEVVKGHYGNDECEFLKYPNDLSWHAKDFYKMLDGSRIATMKNSINHVIRETKRTIVFSINTVKKIVRRSA
jgi:glycosyltransferase involved in cell wall biosynthesis